MTEYERRSSLVKVKVQVVPLHVIKHVGEEVGLRSFLASAVGVNACSALRPCRFCAWEIFPSIHPTGAGLDILEKSLMSLPCIEPASS